MKDIIYIVVLKDEYRKYLELTTINKKFCGRYIKSEYKNVYFELNGSHGVVVIPEEWIEFMAPSKLCNPLYKQNNEYRPLFYKDDLIKTKEMLEGEYNVL